MTFTNNQQRSLLLVDDDRLILSTTAQGLAVAGYKVGTVQSVDEAEKWLDENDYPDLVILDIYMPNRDGIELTPRLQAENNIPFIFLTAYTVDDVVAKANSLGAMSYLVKPVNINQLITSIESAISRAEAA